MKKVLAVVISVVMLAALCACSNFSIFGSDLSGSEWKMTGAELSGLEVDAEFLDELGLAGSIVFDDDTVTLTLVGKTYTASYEVEGDTITLTTAGGDIRTATIEDDVVTLVEDGVGRLIFTRQ